MTFSLVDLALFVALLATTASVLLVYRRLRAMNRMLAEYQAASEATARALDGAAQAVALLNTETRTLIDALIARSSEANGILEDLGRERRRFQVVRPAGDVLPLPPRS